MNQIVAFKMALVRNTAYRIFQQGVARVMQPKYVADMTGADVLLA